MNGAGSPPATPAPAGNGSAPAEQSAGANAAQADPQLRRARPLTTIDVVTPAAGESVTEGTILEWRVKVGERIGVDDTIVEISTDKVDLELPSPASGTVTEILVAEGETVSVGQVIARIAVESGQCGARPAGS